MFGQPAAQSGLGICETGAATSHIKPLFNRAAGVPRQCKYCAEALVFGDLILLDRTTFILIKRAWHDTPLALDLLGNATGLVGNNATGKSTKCAAIRIEAVKPRKQIGQQILADIGFSITT